MIDATVLDLMASSTSRVRRRVSVTTAKILALAEVYRRLGKQFSFGADGQLDARVNSLLVELSDEVMEDMAYAARQTLPEDEDGDTVIAWARLSTNAQNTVDKYSSHLKYILEGWLAIGFANGLSNGRLETMITTYMENPYIAPLWMEAFRDGMEYASKIIREGGYHWGKGTPISPVKGMSIMESTFINTAYQKGVVNGFARRGAIGYRVYRGSSYDCEICDESTIGIHPIDEVILPLHGNCMCYAVPVFEGEESL